MSRLLSISLIYILILSCKPAYKAINWINKKNQFNSQEDYFTFVKKKTDFDLNNFYVVSNSDFNNLLNDIISKNVTYYYGIIQDDKWITSGSNLKDKNSCYGSIKTNINNSINYRNTSAFVKDSICIIKDMKFINSYNKTLQLNNEKKTVVYVYSYKLGKLSKNISDIIEETSQNNINNIIIAIDNLDIKTKTLN